MARKRISEIIEIPSGVNASILGEIIKINKGSESSEKRIEYKTSIDKDKIIIECENPTKNDKKLIKTTKAHIKSMFKGLESKYEYKLQVCAVHFPMNISVQGNMLVIKNFLGEKKERRAEIIPGVEVKVDKELITVKSHNKEQAGQTAANIESAARVRRRDRRVFQDGIYITEKQKGAR